MMDQLRGGRDYQTLFDPDPYLKGYRAETSDSWPFVLSYMESLQKIYSQGKLLHKPFFYFFFLLSISSIMLLRLYFNNYSSYNAYLQNV